MKNRCWLTAVAFTVTVVLQTGAWANPFGEFKSRVQTQLIKPFAKDIGGIIGGSDFNSGRVLGFPGFDAGLAGVVQFKPDSDNLIFTNAKVKEFGLPVVYASFGLPYSVDAVLRGMSASDITLIGGGLRYGVYKSGLAKFVPDVTASVFFDKLAHDYFDVTHYSLDIHASMDIPVIKPFIGVGYDNTKVEIKASNNPLITGLSDTAKEMRYTLGAKFSPVPLIYVFGAYSIFHGSPGAQIGAGARF